MRLRTVAAGALLLALVGVTTTACAGAKLDRDPYEFIEHRNDP